jgi:hypothetical protein
MKIEECSETSTYKIQTPGNYAEETIQNSVHGESLKSRKKLRENVHVLAEPVCFEKSDIKLGV